MPVDLETRELIARGAHGSVFLTFDKSQGRFFALKLVEVIGGDEARRRLLGDLAPFASGEADAPIAFIDLGASADAPPGIASAFPASASKDFLWILMPYVQGPNARELSVVDDAFGPTEVASLLAQVATRLRGLHPALAHLDLKPENVLIDRLGRVFIVDPHMGTVAGTPYFSAPEQRRPEGNPGPAADLYALGKLGACLLAGRFPEEGSDPDFFPELPEAPPDLPAERRQSLKELGQLLRRLCHSDPPKRGTIDEVAKRLLELAVALGGADISAPLVASYARARLPERFARLEAALAKSPQKPLEKQGTGQREGTLPIARYAAILAAAIAALAGAGYVGQYLQRPHITPPEALRSFDAPPLVVPVFTADAPLRQGLAVRVEESDKISPTRALFGLKLFFQAESIAVLSRNGDVVDRIDKPRPNHIYRWDVRAGTFRYEIDRRGYPPDREPEFLAAGAKDIVPIDSLPESAPGKERLPDAGHILP